MVYVQGLYVHHKMSQTDYWVGIGIVCFTVGVVASVIIWSVLKTFCFAKPKLVSVYNTSQTIEDDDNSIVYTTRKAFRRNVVEIV